MQKYWKVAVMSLCIICSSVNNISYAHIMPIKQVMILGSIIEISQMGREAVTATIHTTTSLTLTLKNEAEEVLETVYFEVPPSQYTFTISELPTGTYKIEGVTTETTQAIVCKIE